MIDPQVIAFTGIAAVLTVTPGADTMLVMRNVLARGQRAGLLTTLGICSGLFFHATLSALGLSFILLRSAAAFEVVKLAGACYLIFRGGQSLWRALRGGAAALPEGGGPVARGEGGRWRSYTEGLLTNVLNPKVAVFYIAFLPQFIGPGDPVLAKSVALAVIHAALGVVWLSLVTAFVGRMRAFLSRPRIRRAVEATAGAVLIAFGARLALERR